MKVLITGAAGDIGSRLVSIFQTHEDVALFTTASRSLSSNVKSQHFISDIRDPQLIDWIKHVVPDVIIHLASIIKLSETMTRDEAFDIDVKATERILQASVDCGVKKIVVTSSGAAYGYYADNPEWLSEEMPLRGNDDYFYSSHKRQIEALLAKYRYEYPQLHQVVLRPGTVLGPNFENPITNMFRKKIITGIKGTASPFVIIWVDDLVEYLIEATKSNVYGVFNVAGDGILTLAQIASYLKKPYITIPASLIRGVLGVLKPLGLSQYGPEQVKFIQYRPVLSNAKIKQRFKHQPAKTTEQALLAFLAQSENTYIKAK